MKFPGSLNVAAVLLLAAIVLVAVGATTDAMPLEVRMAAIGTAGFLAGLSFALIRNDDVSAAALTGYGFAVLLTAAVGLSLAPGIGLLTTLAFLMFGFASVSCLVLAVRRIFVDGEAVRLESDWGGLGHGFGGWQISVPAALLLSALAFGSMSIGIVALRERQQDLGGKADRARPVVSDPVATDKAR